MILYKISCSFSCSEDYDVATKSVRHIFESCKVFISHDIDYTCKKNRLLNYSLNMIILPLCNCADGGIDR